MTSFKSYPPTDSLEDISNWIAENKTDLEPTCSNLGAEEIESDGENVVEEPPRPKVKAEAAIQALNICLQWAEENSASLDNILALQNLRESAVENNFASKRTQLKTSQFFKKI